MSGMGQLQPGRTVAEAGTDDSYGVGRSTLQQTNSSGLGRFNPILHLLNRWTNFFQTWNVAEDQQVDDLTLARKGG